ncbi:hypothetical protein HPSD74_0245 [Glaesserella parasuis D74]|nr:hypothetical protein [Glaesserella parasuis]EQA11244.1 hypothetical protein HPSD74_0245 [Glaesserella parasuis D74]
MKQELQLKLCRINPEYTKFLHSIDKNPKPLFAMGVKYQSSGRFDVSV